MRDAAHPMNRVDSAGHPLATIQELRASLDRITPIYVLIDPMLGEPLPGIDAGLVSQRKIQWQRHVETIELDKRVPLQQHQYPYLVELQGLDDPLLETTLTIAHSERDEAMQDGFDGDGTSAHRICGWLQSSMHPPELASHLSQMLRVNTEAYTKATYMRHLDRRVLALLRHVVGNARLTSQFGRLQRWIYLDAYGCLSTLDSAGESITPLYLSREEWSCIEQSELLHRTLAQWLGEAKRLNISQPMHRSAIDIYPQLQNALTASKQAVSQWPHRFTQTVDQTIWAALILLRRELISSKAVPALLQDPGTPDEPAEPLRYLHAEIGALLQSEQHSRQ